MSSSSPFPLADRFRLLLHVLVLVTTATYAYSTENAEPLALVGGACVVAWLLTDAPAARALAEAQPVGARSSLFPNGGEGGEMRRRASSALRIVMFLSARLLPNIAVLVAAILMAERVYLYFNGTHNLITELDGFLVVLMVCKLFEAKSARNIAQILTLSLLLVVSTTMFSNSSLLFFLVLGGYFILLFYIVLLLNLFLETQRLPASAHAPYAIETAAGGRHGRAGAGGARPPGLGRDLANVVQHCLFLAVPVALAVFALVPRSRANSFLGGSWGGGPIQTGFSDTVQFRDREVLVPSDAEVMRVELKRGNGQDAGADFTDLYFRGAVLNEYDDHSKTWSHSPVPTSEHYPPILPPVDNGVTANFTIDHPGRTLFVLAPFVLTSQRAGFHYDADDMILQDRYGSLPAQGRLQYTGIWAPDYQPEIPADACTAHVRFHYTGSWLQLWLTGGWQQRWHPDAGPKCYCPPGELRPWRFEYTSGGHLLREPGGKPKWKAAVQVPQAVTARAYAILQSAMGEDAPRPGKVVPLEQFPRVANIFCTYLRVNFRYSLSSHTSDPNIDYTADFLLHRGIKDDDIGGPCTYFASAMVMLCRSVGMNARMVTGYHGGEYSTYSGEFIIKEKYAHAWAEVFMPDAGWTLYDATPVGSNLDTTAATGHFFNDIFQLLQSVWSATIINFDNDSRAAIAHWVAARWDRLLDWMQFPAWTSMLEGAALAALAAFFWHLRRRWRRLKPLLESTRGLPHRRLRLSNPVGFLEDMLRLFERGAPRRPDLTPLEFLAPHLARLGPAAADARWLIDTAYGVRFGDLHLNPAMRQRIASALKRVRSAARPLKAVEPT